MPTPDELVALARQVDDTLRLAWGVCDIERPPEYAAQIKSARLALRRLVEGLTCHHNHPGSCSDRKATLLAALAGWQEGEK